METYLNKGIKEVIDQFPEVESILEVVVGVQGEILHEEWI